MPRTEPATLVVVIEGFDLPRRRSLQTGAQAPGRDNVHLALRGTCKDRAAVVTPGHPWQATEPIPGDAASVRWQVEVTVRRGEHGLDFGGPFVRGDRADRHLGIVWGDIRADGTFQLICGSKLRLADVDPGLVEGAMRSGGRLLARVRLTDAHGSPICARLKPPDISWSVEVAPQLPNRVRPGGMPISGQSTK